ncbi:MAG: hemerythrin domain-containing protein [Elusimicrobia bacterium]|nr:hemerythrin domain-containing protein [Elusimicrobiota bacterium]
MSVFTSLAEEHALLLRVIGRLERGAVDPDPRAADRETRNTLLVLLRALEAHERLEHLVFDEAPAMSTPDGERARRLIEGQHFVLTRLREEARDLLAQKPDGDGVALRAAAVRLARLLRLHFTDEERKLWPTFNAVAGRSTLHRLSRQASVQLRLMTREIDLYWAAINDYMTGDR